MQIEWILGAPNNTQLIIYFAGWGTSPELVKAWEIPQGYDLLLIWDYRTLTLNVDVSQYSKLHLVAWSMGVWAAEQLVARLNFSSAVAINGTPVLVDDQQGIPEVIFQGTLNGFNEMTRSKFDRRMCGNHELLAQYHAVARRSTDEVSAELVAVAEQLASAKKPKIAWQKALISKQDHIFPTVNQQYYWQQQDNVAIVLLDGPHFVFPLLDGWMALCN